MNLLKLLELKTFFIFFAMGSGFYLLIYYGYIYLNRIEKKYGIPSCGYSWFSRMFRVNKLISIAFELNTKAWWMKSNFWLAKKLRQQYQNDWYSQECIKKIPYEVIKPYRNAFWLAILAAISMYMPEFLDYMGWNYSFYPEKNYSQYLYSNIIK